MFSFMYHKLCLNQGHKDSPMFYCRNFIVLAFTSMSMSYFKFYMDQGSSFFAHRYLIGPAPFIEKTMLSPLNHFVTYGGERSFMHGSISGFYVVPFIFMFILMPIAVS